MRKVILCILVLAISLVALGVSKGTIGISSHFQDNPFFALLTNSAKSVLEDQGFEVIIADAKQDVMKQSNDIDNFIAAGVKAIILTPVDSFALSAAVNRAADAGIPVVCADMTVYNARLASTVESDNFNAGYVVGKYLVEYYSAEKLQGKKAPFQLAVGTYNQANSCIARVEGLKKAIADGPAGLFEIVDEHDCGVNYEPGMNLAQNWLSAYPDLDVIFMVNDMAALGALRAVEQTAAGRDVIVVGIDGNPDAVAEIVKGSAFKCTGAQYPQVMGYVAANMVVDLLAGKTVPTYVKTKTAAIALPTQPWYADPTMLGELISRTIDVKYPISDPVR